MTISLLESPTNHAKIEAHLEKLLPKEENDLLIEAMRYALLGPGKRLRPLLLLASAKTFGVESDQLLNPACAIEMVHAYSLIHDDLPCMDDDDLRRGRPTVHRVYGEAIALLAGDALLTLAFEVLTLSSLEDSIKVKLIKCLATHAGKKGMVGGQAEECTGSKNFLKIFEQKTGDLFSCSLEFGALLAQKEPETMRELGLILGLMYQLSDDLEDGDGAFSKEETQNILQESTERFKRVSASLPLGGTPLKELVTKYMHYNIG